jgi:pimeloyl-ACP methyl ester carboxylesterase
MTSFDRLEPRRPVGSTALRLPGKLDRSSVNDGGHQGAPASSASAWKLRRRAALSGGAVAWDRIGDGAPVVLVHGTPSCSYLWRSVAPSLAERFSVYVIDLLGYGESERREGQDVSITSQGQLLAELLDLWGLDAPGLVGHDVGGAVVLRAHLVERQAARAIALVDSVALNPWNTPTTLHIRTHLDAYKTMPSHIYEEVVKAHLRTAVHRPLDEPTLAAYVRPWLGEDGQAAYFRKIEQWMDEDVGALEQLLPSIEVPVCILWGEEDRWLQTSIARRLQALIPDAELTVIPNAGHFAPEDAPGDVARQLTDFFGRHLAEVPR